MRSTAVLPSLVALLAAAPSALASLATLRGTIPGSLHQCESTNVFFFDSAAARPLTVVFLPAAVAPAATTVSLTEVMALGPLQVVSGINTPDAQQTNFILAIAEGEAFVTYGFLPDGTGKNLNLQRTVQAPLPGATACNPATAASAKAAVGAAAASASSAAAAMTTKARTTVAAAATSPVVAAAATSSALAHLSSITSGAASATSGAGSAAAAASSKGSTSGAVSRVGGVAGALVGAAAAVAALAL